MSLDIHKDITSKLEYFYTSHNVPHIMFHGESGNGKRTIVNNFIRLIYNNDNTEIKNSVIHVNCAHGKGIKFIREELKHFAKTHINSQNGGVFKTILLFNADKLTIDAQSALRRCIELFSHTTRFFLIVEDKYKLLKPIISRFCEIYIPYPFIDKSYSNLYQYHLEDIKDNNLTIIYLKKYLIDIDNPLKIVDLANKLYDKGITGIDLITYIKSTYKDDIGKYKLLMVIQKVKKEFRSEKLVILFILNLMFFRSEQDLENILDM